ncbi:GMC family oxidoreductase [Natronomonas halophila]|uniref:GMC family oxidoreductase N-terminal domain-containing protein n=1 Tax=Natronomonas halophila TaxID=2747817 RepID=UPI0015B3F26E|nr:GMC family oxidoreductase [Natronomonas halophila]QLD86332.1 GMC family oxidoreductase [Natronomonas halophila]
MVQDEYDVVIVGAGGDGPVAAWKLGKAGLDVLVLEAGPFHGNENWPNPHEGPGKAKASDSIDDLSGDLLDEQFTTRELEMTQKLLFGPADHERGYWFRKFPGAGATLQAAGVGGTTLLYTGNHPRAYPAAIDEQGHWPNDISYEDLLPYYREVEGMLDVQPAPVTAKEELFFQGAESAGWDLIDDKNVDSAGYRPQPNALMRPDEKLHVDNDYDGNFRHPDADNPEDPVEGHTLAAHEIVGNPVPRGAPFEEKAKKASNVGFVPPALETGNVTVRPNAFATDVLVDRSLCGNPEATGIEFRDTWSGDTRQVSADAVVLAAGAIETPRLWLNSGLPNNGWVGKGMTIHFGDNVMGFWEEEVLEERVGKPAVDPQEGQTIAARFDYPGVGMLQTTGSGPGIAAVLGFGASASGFTFTNDVSDAPWDSQGRIAGTDLKEFLSRYRQALPILVVTDDRPHQRNGVSVAPGLEDEHGPVPQVNYVPSEGDVKRRDELAEIATDILKEAGADHVHRSDSPATALHIHSTMAMGKVVDTACEAYDVDRLFVADHSALANGVGGPNPTNTGQALAARTAEKIVDRYFSKTPDCSDSFK